MKSTLRSLALSALLFFAVSLSCFTVVYRLPWQLHIVSAVLFIGANIMPSFRKSVKGRLRIESDGADILCAFLVTVVPEAVLAASLSRSADGYIWERFVICALIVWLAELIVFWNGIIRVYVTSSMMGAKWRITGLICGMIPIVHIFALLNIIYVTRCEVDMETSRIKRNKERADKKVCQTKYPLVLVHGVFFRDSKRFNYWGRIPKELEKNGATIYYGGQQSALGIVKSGEELAQTIRSVIESTGAEKVNIIAHSKGGLDSRYAITKLGMDKYVASLTTVNTPHRGCVFAEWLLGHAPEKSIGSKINHTGRNVFPLNFSYLLARFFDGPNDGLVTLESAKWGERFLALTSLAPDGVSHADVIDLMRRDKPDFDIREFYVSIVSELKDAGF